MEHQERVFLQELRDLTVSAIGEQSEMISDGVRESLPPEHPLKKMLALLESRLRRENCVLKPKTDLKIKNAAKLRATGSSWKEIEDALGEGGGSFVRDLKPNRKYHDRFISWSKVFETKAE